MRTLEDAEQYLAEYKAEVERRDEIIASETALNAQQAERIKELEAEVNGLGKLCIRYNTQLLEIRGMWSSADQYMETNFTYFVTRADNSIHSVHQTMLRAIKEAERLERNCYNQTFGVTSNLYRELTPEYRAGLAI